MSNDTEEPTKTEPVAPKPIAEIRVSIAAYIPRPDFPEVGDMIEVQPVVVPLFPVGSKDAQKHLPRGYEKTVKAVLSELAELCHNHIHAPLSAEQIAALTKTEDKGLISAAPKVSVYVNDGTGKPIELPEHGILDAQGIEL